MVCGALQNEEVTVNLRIRIPCSAPAGGWAGGAQANPRMGNPVAYLQFYTIYLQSVATIVEMKLFCRYIGGLSAGHISPSLGRLKYIAIYRIHSAGSNIYRDLF